MKNKFFIILGAIITLSGILTSIWFGVWWMFIGGIIMIIEAAKSDPINSMNIALGIARVFFCEIAGLGIWLSVILGTSVSVIGGYNPIPNPRITISRRRR
jgi:hypothetical protein